MKTNESYEAFLGVWHLIMDYLFIISLAIAVILVITYKVKYALAGSFKEKYDVAGKFEVKYYLRANYFLAAAIFFILNTVFDETVRLSPVWSFIRIFVSMCIATLHIYIAYLIFKYYYPKPLEKKMKKLRYTPRINPSTGNTMKLLSESEEDAYLDEGMQAEENAFSVDYDVWIDPETQETKIEKYAGHLSAFECDRCGFQTLKLVKEEVIKEPTDFSEGEILKEFECSYCGRIKRKTQNLSKHMDKEAIVAHAAHHEMPKIDAIKIEIHGVNGQTKVFEFQNTDQAKHFLDEFDFDKLPG